MATDDGISREQRRFKRLQVLLDTADRMSRRAFWSRRNRLGLRAEARATAAELEETAAVLDAIDDVTDAESHRLDALTTPVDEAPTKEHWDTHPDDPHGFGRGS